jgi:hypothetical protein
MSRWFRIYDSALDDPKVQRLPPALFKTWINLLCVASRNDGRLPKVCDIAFLLRMDEKATALAMASLLSAGLIDKDEKGYFPHNWNARQYKSDDVTGRVRKHRMKRVGNVSCNVSSAVTETLAETPPDTDTETETEKEVVNTTSLLVVPMNSAVDDPANWLENEIAKAFFEFGEFVPNTRRAATWVAMGYDPTLALAVVRESLARKPAGINSLKYFDQAIANAHGAKPLPREVSHVRQAPQSVQQAAHELYDEVCAGIEERRREAALRDATHDHAPRLLSAGGGV